MLIVVGAGGFSLMSTMNYYVVLGIAEDADVDTIRSAFRALACLVMRMPCGIGISQRPKTSAELA